MNEQAMLSSESATVNDAAPAVATVATAQLTSGQMLRQAREAQGLHIAALAVSLKVSVKRLEALEADRLDLLPDAVFVRALASSICRSLKIDPVPVLAALPQTEAPRLRYTGQGINTPFQVPGQAAPASKLSQISKPWVLTTLALLLGALVVIFFPATELDTSMLPDALNTSAPTSISAGDAPAVAQGAAVPVLDTVQAVTRSQSAAAPPAASAQETAAITPPVTSLLPQSPAVALKAESQLEPKVQSNPDGKSAVVAAGVLVFKARGESWVEVVDSNRVVVLRKTLIGGEVLGVSGALPLAVVLGRADAVDVQVRGQVFNLPSVTKANVAHFEVK